MYINWNLKFANKYIEKPCSGKSLENIINMTLDNVIFLVMRGGE